MSNKNFDNQILKNMSDKKQTAIEWLINEWPILKSNLPIWLIEQAKEMEKEQIAKAFDDGDYNYHYSRKTGNDFENGEEYFKELYGGNK
jgi:hypothetical protein